MADIRRLTASFSVAPQNRLVDVPLLAAAGFKSLMNNRPDGESVGQPENRVIDVAARNLGLAYRFLPVVSGQITDADVARFAAAVRLLPKPVLAFCRSGTRCTMLWALAEAAERTPDEILGVAARAGYDLEGLRPRLDTLRAAAVAAAAAERSGATEEP